MRARAAQVQAAVRPRPCVMQPLHACCHRKRCGFCVTSSRDRAVCRRCTSVPLGVQPRRAFALVSGGTTPKVQAGIPDRPNRLDMLRYRPGSSGCHGGAATSGARRYCLKIPSQLRTLATRTSSHRAASGHRDRMQYREMQPHENAELAGHRAAVHRRLAHGDAGVRFAGRGRLRDRRISEARMPVRPSC